MCRSQQLKLLPFDPEIERTLKVLKKKSREGELETEMEGIPAFRAGNMGQDVDQEGNNGGKVDKCSKMNKGVGGRQETTFVPPSPILSLG